MDEQDYDPQTLHHLEAARRRWMPAAAADAALPQWLRPHRGEARWSITLVIAIAIAIQFVLPDRLVLRPRVVAPMLEGVLVLILIAWNPGRIEVFHPVLRRLSMLVIGLLALTNAISTILLCRLILEGTQQSAVHLLASGAAIWLTNVIVYSLWYWEFDRGGPAARASAIHHTPDFLFPQMTDERLDPMWRATYIDYLYVSLTNATAFSPTDTMPLSKWAKMLMATQSVVALITVGLVAARAVNILPS